MCYFCTLNYDLPPAANMQLQQKLKKEDEFRETFRICLNEIFYKDIEYRINHNMNIILSILGFPGSGKSHAGIYIAKYISSKAGVDFPNDARNIVFNYQEFLNAVKESKPKETFVQDEQRVLDVGLGSRALAEEIRDIERIIRKRQNNMIYIAPTLESHLHFGILEPIGINYEHKIARLMFYDNKQIPRGKIYTREPNPEIIKYYEEKKNRFIEKIVHRSMGDTLEEIEKILANLKTDEEFMRLSNKPKRIFHIAKKYPTLPYQMQELIADLATD